MNEHVNWKRVAFVSRCKVWSLKEAEIREVFRAKGGRKVGYGS